jgi:purine-binding chemotaxis protein CheW
MSVREADPGHAGAAAAGPVAAEVSQLVVCRVGREECAMDIQSVREINRVGEITRVPKTSSFVEGVISLRGRIIPVLDLRRRFGLPGDERSPAARIIVVTVQGRTVGLIVEKVMEVLRAPRTSIEPPPSLGHVPAADFVQGVVRLEDRLVSVLDLERLLAPSEATVVTAPEE